jgi:hypothetical protein
MSLPATIPVRYTEDEAEYVSLRPIVRQTFQLRELVEMILSVSGKDAQRIQKLLAAGSVTYHGYRYWWDGFAADLAELEVVLGSYPDADPERIFEMARCSAVIFEAAKFKEKVEVSREQGAAGKWYRRGNFWGVVEALAGGAAPAYAGYTYEKRADLYETPIDGAAAGRLVEAAKRYLARPSAALVATMAKARRIVWICPRGGERQS